MSTPLGQRQNEPTRDEDGSLRQDNVASPALAIEGLEDAARRGRFTRVSCGINEAEVARHS